MTIVDNYFPFDTGPGSAATAARWRLMARLFSGSGVVPNFLNQMNPTIAGSVVTIDTGAVWIDGYYGESDSPKALNVTGSGMVVARMDPNARQILLVYVAGQNTPTQNQNSIYEIPIMQVTGSTGIDIRQFAVEASTAVPSGTIFDFGGLTVPVGWLACNGASVLRATYPALFAAIGTQWGTPTDGNHFTLPDMRNKFAIGAGSVLLLGASGGSQLISAANMPSHGHGVSDGGHQHGGNGGQITIQSPGSTLGLVAGGGAQATFTPVTAPATTGIGIQAAGSGQPYLPPAAGVNKMIKV